MIVSFNRADGEIAKRSGRKPSRRTPASEPRTTMLEKRWAMPDSKRLVSALVLRSSLALLALVLVAPIQLPGFITVSSRPDCLHGKLALCLDQRTNTTRLGAAMATHAVGKMKALRYENEEE